MNESGNRTEPEERQALFVLGMHRSGTSAVTGMMSLLGASHPKTLMKENEWNPKGYWESEALMQFHDRMLETAGSSWNDWRPFNPDWYETNQRVEFQDELQALLAEEFGAADLFVLKDPRACRLVPFWLEALEKFGATPKIILPFRNPIEVARSLEKRDGLPVEEGLLLWLRHSLDAESGTRHLMRSFTSYEKVLAGWRDVADNIAEDLGFSWPNRGKQDVEKEIDEFLTGSLRHGDASTDELNLQSDLVGWIADTYDCLRELASRQGDGPAPEATYARLDAVRQSFDQTIPFLHTAFGLHKSALEASRQEAADLLSRYEELDEQFKYLKYVSAEAADTAEKAIAELEELNFKRGVWQRTLASMRAELSESRHQLTSARKELAAVSPRIGELQAKLLAKEAGLVEERQKSAALQEELLASFDEVVQLREQTSGKEEALAQAVELNETSQEEIDRLNEALGAMEDRFFEKGRELKRTEDDRLAAQRVVSSQRYEIAELTQRINAVEEELALRTKAADDARMVAAQAEEALEEERARRQDAETSFAALQAEVLAREGSFARQLQVAAESVRRVGASSRSLLSPDYFLPGRRRQRRRKARMAENVRIVETSTLFDRDWYLGQYADVGPSGMDPVVHYLRFGADEGRDPGPDFSTAWYRGFYPDVATSGINPLVHYILFGEAEGRSACVRDCPAIAPGIEAVARPAVQEIDREDALSLPDWLRFDDIEQPDITIVVPVYNQITYTMMCLRSLAMQTCRRTFEVVVMDDCSSDETQHLLPRIPGLRYFRNEENLGFIGNCNRGAELSRGRYIVFLNNDTQTQPGWLDALYETFEKTGNAGLVGSQLIYPDGRLQEAGGIVWEDASGWNWGRLDDPFHPRYSYARDVDYVSGASIMVPRDLFLSMGGFSTSLENSYYEDTYLAFSLREAGYRVIYQPASKVIHFEGITSGTDESAGTKKYQAVNKEIFFNRWKDVLKSHLPNGENPAKASDRTPIGHVLIVDAVTPAPDQDSGSIDMLNLIRILIRLGYRVHFVPLTNMAFYGQYTSELQAMGVECVYAPYYPNLESYLVERGDCFDFAILTRVRIAEEALPVVRQWAPGAATLFYTVDMHGIREIRKAELEGSEQEKIRAHDTLQREMDIIRESDVSIVLSDYEAKFLSDRGLSNIAILPLLRDSVQGSAVRFEDRNDVAFIGGFQHTPNVDAVRFLVEDIWPAVRRKLAEKGLAPITLKIVGSKMPAWIHDTRRDDIVPIGYVEDLGDLFDHVRLSVAPLRYGAGLKGKIATSLGYGVPVVGTSIAFEGMPGDDAASVEVIADDAESLAAEIVDLYHDKARWEAISKAGPSYVNSNYSTENALLKVREILQSVTGARDRRIS